MAQTNQNDKTPQQRNFEVTTGKDADSALGPVDTSEEQEPVKESQDTTGVPKDVDKDTWEEAKRAIVSMTGGFAGVPKDRRNDQIREKYDQLRATYKQAGEWEGKQDGDV